MRIAIFTNNYLPNPYGLSMSIESFRKELEKLGHIVYIFAPRFSGYKDKNENVFRYPSLDVVLKGVRYPISIPYSTKMNKVLKDLEIDIVHAQHTSLLGWQAKRWAKKKNVPIIFTWHTLYDQYAHFVPLFPSRVAAAIAIRNAVDYANSVDQVIVPTPSVKQIIEKWGVKNNIEAIASGVVEESFEIANREMIRKKYCVADDEILLLLVSRLTAEKNVGFLFDTLVPVLKENKKIKFLVVGGGNERNELEKNISKFSLNEQVFFTGIIAANEIKNYYAAADIFVHASKSETQGMILTEAMYMGLPVVSVAATGAKDLVRNNITGFLVEENEHEFAKAVKKLVDDKHLRANFSLKARQIAKENYTSKICAQKLLKVYEQATSKKIL